MIDWLIESDCESESDWLVKKSIGSHNLLGGKQIILEGKMLEKKK